MTKHAHALDKDSLDRYSPFVPDFRQNGINLECNGFTFDNNTLDSASTNDMTERCLCTFNESLVQICDSKCCPVRV